MCSFSILLALGVDGRQCLLNFLAFRIDQIRHAFTEMDALIELTLHLSQVMSLILYSAIALEIRF